MVDIEADGPIPGDYSMVCFGAVVVDASLERTFYAQLRPISEQWVPEALAVSGFTREQTGAFPDPKAEMQRFAEWLGENLATADLRLRAQVRHPRFGGACGDQRRRGAARRRGARGPGRGQGSGAHRGPREGRRREARGRSR